MRVSTAWQNNTLEANRALFNSGKLRIYSGTRPANANTALAGNTLLAELTFGATAFAAATGGTMTANAITSDNNTPATGTAAWARCVQSNGTTVICDLSVSVTGGGGEVQFSSLAFVTASVVSATSCVLTAPAGA